MLMVKLVSGHSGEGDNIRDASAYLGDLNGALQSNEDGADYRRAADLAEELG